GAGVHRPLIVRSEFEPQSAVEPQREEGHEARCATMGINGRDAAFVSFLSLWFSVRDGVEPDWPAIS
ncbi:MAG: hypothetical protein ACREOC_14915, partial [Gemmatimonadales bacterium]